MQFFVWRYLSCSCGQRRRSVQAVACAENRSWRTTPSPLPSMLPSRKMRPNQSFKPTPSARLNSGVRRLRLVGSIPARASATSPRLLCSLRLVALRLYASVVGRVGVFGGTKRRGFSPRPARLATTAAVQFTPGFGSNVVLGPHRLTHHSSRRRSATRLNSGVRPQRAKAGSVGTAIDCSPRSRTSLRPSLRQRAVFVLARQAVGLRRHASDRTGCAGRWPAGCARLASDRLLRKVRAVSRARPDSSASGAGLAWRSRRSAASSGASWPVWRGSGRWRRPN